MQQDSDLPVRLYASPCTKEGKSHRYCERTILSWPFPLESLRGQPYRWPAQPWCFASKNKVVEHGTFSLVKKMVFSHHVSPAIHHDLTIKKPRSAPHFSRKPLQKHPPPPQQIFLPVR
jgi:hypothetical protein